jgi:MazG family protein
MNNKKNLEDLTSLVERLRGPDGCPWDREQTLSDLKAFLIGETYEILDAIDQNNSLHIQEEAGDLLFLIIFLVDMLRESGDCTIYDVIGAVMEKMIRRHPHVFAHAQADNAAEVKINWRKIKEKEGKIIAGTSLLAGIPEFLPALFQAQLLTQKASQAGFDWQTRQQVFEKIEEELVELKESIEGNDHNAIESELGDVLFSLVNLGRFMKMDSEQLLRRTNKKFTERFQFIEQSLRDAGRDIKHASLEEMEELWEKAKAGKP